MAASAVRSLAYLSQPECPAFWSGQEVPKGAESRL